MQAFPSWRLFDSREEGGADSKEDNGPSEALDIVGGGEEVGSHNEQKEMMKMMLSVLNENKDEPSVSLICKYAVVVAC